jgi:hypothetical protein
METMVFGAVINEVGASAAALSSGLRNSTAEAVALAQSGNLDADKMRQINIRNGEQMQKDFINQRAIGLVGAAEAGGLGQELARSFGISIQELQKMTPEAIAAAEKAAKEQKGTVDDLTTNMNMAAIAAKDLAIALQELLLKYLPTASKANKAVLESMQNMVREAMGEKSIKTSPTAMNMSNEDLKNQMSMTGVDVRTGQPLTSAQFRELKKSGTIPELNEGKALGGISKGPVSGYSETLHGTEAVVPLPDNRSIPVSMDSSSITAAVNQQSGILAEILRAMQNSNSISSQIAMNTV